MSKPNEWRFHIGAHKTGTTHLQAILAHMSPNFKGSGVLTMPVQQSRPICRFRPRKGLLHKTLKDRYTRRFKNAKRLQELAAGASTVLISEEDLLGWSQDQLASKLYPELSRLDLLPIVSEGAKLNIYVSIRSYDTLLPSAFFETYKIFRDAPDRLRNGIAAVLGGQSNWVELLDRISERYPMAKIHFWRQEDYAQDAKPVVDALMGMDVGPVPDIPRPRSTKSPNAHALEEMAKLPLNLAMKDRHKQAEAIYARYPCGEGPEPELLSAAEVSSCRTAYVRDVKLLQARFTDIGKVG